MMTSFLVKASFKKAILVCSDKKAAKATLRLVDTLGPKLRRVSEVATGFAINFATPRTRSEINLPRRKPSALRDV
jgi:hypothetical protein